jgi:hypothetical protein
MSTETVQQAGYTLTITSGERDGLVALLRQSLAETRVEAHHTHTPAFRDMVLGQEAAIRVLIDKLVQVGADPGTSCSIAAGIEEGAGATDDLYLDAQGRFQMASNDLESVIRFLRDNDVRVEEEAAAAFRSGGTAFGYGQLLHPFDVDLVKTLHRTWKTSPASREVGAM